MNLGSLAVKIRSWVISLIILVVLLLGVQFLFPEEAGSPIEPTGALALTLIVFLFALALKINYTHKIFIATVFVGILLVSLFNFTQGLLAILGVLLVQKLLKIL